MPSNTKEYAKKYQSNPKNKRRYNELQNKRRSETVNKNKKLVNVYKDQPCLDCGLRFPLECMDFDHVSGTKIAGISQMIHHKATSVLLEEIAKCELVCANCHRIRTTKRRKQK